jgi:uncharacterized RDD family membrane protein YckC
MEDDRLPAEQPAGDAVPPPTTPPPPATSAPPPPAQAPAVAWGPPPGTTAPVPWAVAEAPVRPPPPGTAYAGVGIRFLALILDLVPLCILGIVVVGPVLADLFTTMADALPARPSVGRDIGPEFQAAMADAMTSAAPGLLRASALFQLGGLLYIAGSWLAFSRSPAMALLGIRIVREEDGGRLNVARVAVRYGGYLLSALPFLLGFAWALFDNRKQTWHDKLAGTVVVRPVSQVQPQAAPWPSPYSVPAAPIPVDPPAPVDPIAPAEQPAVEAQVRKRPSIGAVAEAAWWTFSRSFLDLLASLAVVLVPAMIVLLPLIALYLIVAQDQAVLAFQLIGDMFNVGLDDRQASSAQFLEYNRQILASTAPSVRIGILAATVASVTGSLLIGATAAAVDDSRSIRPASAVTRALVERLPALLAMGVVAGVVAALEVLVLGLPSLAAAAAGQVTTDALQADLSADPYGSLLTTLLALVIVPVSLYFSVVWVLAIVCVVQEGLGVTAALRRAWQLSRGRMRWLIGISVGVALALYSVLAPLGSLPVALLAEQYIAGGRLPVALSVISLGLLVLLSAPLCGLIYVEAYRAAREEAAAASVPA